VYVVLDRLARGLRDYLRYLTLLESDYGHLSAAKLKRPNIILLRDRFDDTPRKANFIVQILSILMEHAIDRGFRETNPATGIDPLETGDGHRPWEETEIKKYRERWPLGTLLSFAMTPCAIEFR